MSENEFAVDLGYTRLLSDVFAGAVAIRYIRSDLTGGQQVNGVETHAGNSFATDVAFYYQNEISAKDWNRVIIAWFSFCNWVVSFVCCW